MDNDMLVSIDDAVEQGETRIRKPIWANKLDHLEIHIVNNTTLGIWGHLYSPANLAINGRDPVDMLMPLFNVDTARKEWAIYRDALPDSDEYRASVIYFSGLIDQVEGVNDGTK